MTENTFSISMYSCLNCIRFRMSANYEVFFKSLFDAVINVGIDT